MTVQATVVGEENVAYSFGGLCVCVCYFANSIAK